MLRATWKLLIISIFREITPTTESRFVCNIATTKDCRPSTDMYNQAANAQ